MFSSNRPSLGAKHHASACQSGVDPLMYATLCYSRARPFEPKMDNVTYGTVVGQQTPNHISTGSSGATASSACPAVSIAAGIAVLDSDKAVTALGFSTAGGGIAARVDTVDNVSGYHQRARN